MTANKRKRLVHGVGINNADYSVTSHSVVGGKKVVTGMCSAYASWINMLCRCYCDSFKAKNKTYSDCFVCDDWLIFLNYKKWFDDNYVCGYQLDKDIINIGNKEYSPKNCAFVHKKVNSFLVLRGASRGKYLIGASFEKATGKFKARCSNTVTGKIENLGRFDDEVSAHLAWAKRKSEIAIDLSSSKYVTTEAIILALISIDFRLNKDLS